MTDKISIIVPVFNAEKYISETIDCVRNQTYANWELLLIDDGSTDKSRQVIEELLLKNPDERIRLLMKENSGAARTRNAGLEAAKGRYIAYLDADDLWREEKLEKQLDFMREREAAFSFTDYEFADRDGAGTGKVVRVPDSLTYKQALKNTTIFTSTVMFDTDKISKEQLLMPAIKSEDTALWFRVLRQGYTAYGLDENLVRYRRMGGTLSSNKLEALRRIWNLYRKAEGLSFFYSAYNFCFWAVHAVKRRL